jgi:hypothetical protein
MLYFDFWYVCMQQNIGFFFISVVSSTVSVFTCICWIANLIIKKCRRYRLRQKYEFQLAKNLESLRKRDRQDLLGFESLEVEDQV